MNPRDFCQRINQFVVPELVAYGALLVVFALTGQWLELLFNLPAVAWLVYVRFGRRDGGRLDPTTVFSRVAQIKTRWYVALGFNVVIFFWYLYKMVHSLITSSMPTHSNLARHLRHAI